MEGDFFIPVLHMYLQAGSSKTNKKTLREFTPGASEDDQVGFVVSFR